VTHGTEYTRQFILLYTIILVLITVMPYLSGMSGLIYLATALVLGTWFMVYAIRLKRSNDDNLKLPMQMFRFSINYLMFLFAALLVDHYFIIRLSA
jgi:protoheme IX farnesyltransferase